MPNVLIKTVLRHRTIILKYFWNDIISYDMWANNRKTMLGTMLWVSSVEKSHTKNDMDPPIVVGLLVKEKHFIRPRLINHNPYQLF